MHRRGFRKWTGTFIYCHHHHHLHHDIHHHCHHHLLSCVSVSRMIRLDNDLIRSMSMRMSRSALKDDRVQANLGLDEINTSSSDDTAGNPSSVMWWIQQDVPPQSQETHMPSRESAVPSKPSPEAYNSLTDIFREASKSNSRLK